MFQQETAVIQSVFEMSILVLRRNGRIVSDLVNLILLVFFHIVAVKGLLIVEVNILETSHQGINVIPGGELVVVCPVIDRGNRLDAVVPAEVLVVLHELLDLRRGQVLEGLLGDHEGKWLDVDVVLHRNVYIVFDMVNLVVFVHGKRTLNWYDCKSKYIVL